MDALGHVETFVAGAAQLAPMAGAGIDLGMVALTLSKLLASFPGLLSNPAVLCALFGIAPFNGRAACRRSARVNIGGPAAHGLPLGGCAAGEPVLPDARAASSPDRASVMGCDAGSRPAAGQCRFFLDYDARLGAHGLCRQGASLLVLPQPLDGLLGLGPAGVHGPIGAGDRLAGIFGVLDAVDARPVWNRDSAILPAGFLGPLAGGGPLLGLLDVGRPRLVLAKALKRLVRIEDVAEVPLGIGGQFFAGITCVLNAPGGLCLVQDDTVMRLPLLSRNSPVLCLFALALLALPGAADKVVGGDSLMNTINH